MTKEKTAIVIGSGVAGLASACRLAKSGYDVQVFEASPTYGGKLGNFQKDGFRFDQGPSLFTLPHLLDDLFKTCGEDPREYFSYHQLPIITKYFFPDGQEVNAYADLDAFQEELVSKLQEDKAVLVKFFRHIEKVYNYVYPIFLENPIRKFYKNIKGSFFHNVKMLLKIDGLITLEKSNRNWFKNPKTQQIFNRFATYNGSNPFRAPATLNVIPHLEHNLGAFFVDGGMRVVADAMYQLALKLGVEFKFNTLVSAISVANGKAIGVQVDDTFYESDQIVCNMDVNYAYPLLLKDQQQAKRLLRQEKSSSALVFYWSMDLKSPSLDVHNILFSKNYKEEFEYLSKGLVYADPTVYIYISSKAQSSDAPEGKENWFVMINVPFDAGQDWEKIKLEMKMNIKSKIKEMLQIDVDSFILNEAVLDPKSIASKTKSYAGALYGNSSNSMFAAFLRHPHKNKIQQLSFVGGSVHPGGGIPLCLLSAKIACEHIK